MIECKNIAASYRSVPILGDISLNAHAGEFLGIIGPNGAGKTTLLKVLAGVKKPSAGTVLLDNNDIAAMNRASIARLMAVVPQSTFVPPLFTVEDVVSIGRYARRRNRFIESDDDRRAVEDALCKTGSIRFRERFMTELSGGERQEVLIARALAQEPKILLLDEPTANLDVRHQLGILDLVKDLVTGGGLCAVMVVHDLNMAARYCTRLALLDGGVILAQGTPADMLTPGNLARAYGVRATAAFDGAVGAVQVTVLSKLDTNDREGRT